MLALVATAPGGFVLVLGRGGRPAASCVQISMASLLDTARSMQGPEILWGSEGVPLGYDESEIKGYDNFGRFCAAIEANGLVEELQSGEYTLLVPSDSAFDEHESEGRGAVTADILRYHMIPGRKSLESLTGDQPTVQGGTLKCAARVFGPAAQPAREPRPPRTATVTPPLLVAGTNAACAKTGWTTPSLAARLRAGAAPSRPPGRRTSRRTTESSTRLPASSSRAATAPRTGRPAPRRGSRTRRRAQSRRG